MITANYSRTIQDPVNRRMMEEYLVRMVKNELRDMGLYIADSDTFDLDAQGYLILQDGFGGSTHLPDNPSSHRHSTLIAAAFYLRDMDGDA